MEQPHDPWRHDDARQVEERRQMTQRARWHDELAARRRQYRQEQTVERQMTWAELERMARE